MTPGQRAIIEGMRLYGIPITRKNYIESAWTETPDPWTPEHEDELPEFLQQGRETQDDGDSRK